MSQSASRARPKPVQVFAVQATALALLLGFLPGMQRAYPTLFNAHAEIVYNAVLAVVAPGHHLRVATLDADYADRRDTRMVGFAPEREERAWRQFYRVFGMGWWPTACVAAMVLATPLPWRRRVVALALGVAIADVLILIRIGVMIFLNYAVSESVSAERWESVRGVAEESFRSWVPPLVIALLSWASVARPATTIDLAAARRLLEGWRPSAAPPREGAGDDAARRVAEEGQEPGDGGSGASSRGP